ncbi:MAG: glycosyltransferase, partial [Clostridia bacterium]|nr:glycosyltransferase [Clostridia bacterium]
PAQKLHDETVEILRPGAHHDLLRVHREAPAAAQPGGKGLAQRVTALAGAAIQNMPVVIGEDGAHYYRAPDVALLYLLARFASLVKAKDSAETLNKKVRRRIREKKYRAPSKTCFRKSDFDVVVANTVPRCAPTAAYIRSNKKYAVFHSSKAEFFPDETAEALRRFDGLIAVSEGVRQVLADAYPAYREKLLTVTNYVDADAIRQKALDGTPPERGEAPVLCTCGRLSREKGFDLAVEAARLLKTQGHTFIWYFVGDGDCRKALEEKIHACGLDADIVITGFLTNPYPYIAGCDIYIQPSREESYGLTIAEARILNRVIVATETVGAKTVFAGGAWGILTPVSAEGLAEGIGKLLRDSARRTVPEQCRYTPEDSEKDRQAFVYTWDRLLSE